MYKRTIVFAAAALSAASLLPGRAVAEDPPPTSEYDLPELVITGRGEDLVGLALSAAEGRVGTLELSLRPWLRPGEILEVVPGLMITQHSGTGKANQYFLRGFNLDHGTDFSASIDGVPLNLPSHGHGQGYLDLNFVIPEAISAVDYRKGPYWASAGDFSSAGSANLRIANTLPRGFARVGVGFWDFYRLVALDTPEIGSGNLLYAVETELYDGPWDLEENFRKFDGVLKYTMGTDERGASFGLIGYTSEWSATDQIPLRAVEAGTVSRLGTIDPTDGGDTSRVILYTNLWNEWDDLSTTRLDLWAQYYELDLFSNFTFFLDNPALGDQIEQVDQRAVTGFHLSHRFAFEVGERSVDNLAGLQFRNDFIPDVGLFRTDDRMRIGTVRDDEVLETSVGLYLRSEVEILEKLRAMGGLRGDFYAFDVESNTPVNSGTREDAAFSPKAGLIAGPWADTEFYGNWGIGFHSNDARGTVIAVDPVTGDPVERVDPLVESQGVEVGVRTSAVPGLVSTLSLWYLELDSELLFVGDAGTTEVSRASERFGVEWANFWQPLPWLTLDADVAWTRSRFTELDPAGGRIPGAFETVVTSGASVDFPCGFFGALRLRHFGPRPLLEDNSVRSDATTLVNLKVGYRITENMEVNADVLNVLDSDDHDIDYFYESRLPGEPAAGVSDLHFHPVEPLTARLYVTWYFR